MAPQGRYPEVPRLWRSREEAERFAAMWREPRIEARLPDFPFSIDVPDPPPMVLGSGGRIYYLAHFNANKAIYSAAPLSTES